jgi:HlyD family secretion protein
MKRALIIILLIAVLAGGSYFLYDRNQQAQAAAQNIYQTALLKKGDLTATVGATGTVRTNQTTTVNWQTSGRIGKIMVKEGDTVTLNQVLAELDPASLPQNLILARADLVTAQRNLDNLKNSDTARTQAQQTLVQAQKNLTDAQGERYRKNLARVSRATIDQKQAELVIAQDKLKNAKENYAKFENKPEGDLMRAQAFDVLAQAQQKVDQLQYDLAWLTGGPDVNEIAQADAAIAVATAKLADAQREWDRLKNGVDPQDLAAAQARIDSIRAILSQTQLTAPINGAVTDIKSMAGDQVNPGTVSFRIDDLAHMLVDVQITEVDINRIKISQSARMTFDAIPNQEYSGKVVKIADFGTSVGGVVNFTVTLELTDADAQVRSGMTAAVNLTVDQLSNVLLVPNRAVRLRSGQRIIYLLQNGQPAAVDINMGAISDTYSQIVSGNVKENDEVILNPPAAALQPAAGGGGLFGGGR